MRTSSLHTLTFIHRNKLTVLHSAQTSDGYSEAAHPLKITMNQSHASVGGPSTPGSSSFEQSSMEPGLWQDPVHEDIVGSDHLVIRTGEGLQPPLRRKFNDVRLRRSPSGFQHSHSNRLQAIHYGPKVSPKATRIKACLRCKSKGKKVMSPLSSKCSLTDYHVVCQRPIRQ